MKKILEKDVQKQCIDFLGYKNIFCFKINNVGVYKQATGSYIPAQTKGIPDAIFHLDGVIHYVEFKTPSGRLSESQLNFKHRCQIDGVPYHVIRSIEELNCLIKNLTDCTTKL